MLSKVAGAIFGPGNDFSALALFQYSCLAIHVFWFIFFPWFLSISDALGSHCSGYGEVLGLCWLLQAKKLVCSLTWGQLRSSSVTPDTACSSGLKSRELGTNLRADAACPCAGRSCRLLCAGDLWPYGCSTAACLCPEPAFTACFYWALLRRNEGTAHCCSHCDCTWWCKAGLLCCSHREPSRALVFLYLLSLPDLHKRQVKGMHSLNWAEPTGVAPALPQLCKASISVPTFWAEQCQVCGQANFASLSLGINSRKGRIKTRKKKKPHSNDEFHERMMPDSFRSWNVQK